MSQCVDIDMCCSVLAVNYLIMDGTVYFFRHCWSEISVFFTMQFWACRIAGRILSSDLLIFAIDSLVFRRWFIAITIRRNCSSASNSAYSYTFLRSVVCLSVVCHARAACLKRSMDSDVIWLMCAHFALHGVPVPQRMGRFGVIHEQLQIAATWRIERKLFRLLPNYFAVCYNPGVLWYSCLGGLRLSGVYPLTLCAIEIYLLTYLLTLLGTQLNLVWL